MKKIHIPGIVGLLFLAACKSPAPQEQPPKSYTIAQFMDIVQINGAAFSPDDSQILISSKETGIYNAVAIDVKTGEKKQLTQSTDNSIRALSYFPSDDRIIYNSDKGGNEIGHLYMRATDGTIKDLIADSTAKATYYGWSHNKKLLYYASNSRDKRFFDLYKIQIENPTAEGVFHTDRVYENKDGLDIGTISDNDRYIALTKNITEHNQEMYLLDTQTGKTKHLTPHEGDITYAPQYFSPDGTKLFFLTDEGSEFSYLASYDLGTGEKKKAEEAKWDIMYAYLSHNGKYLVVAVNNDARTEIKIYDESQNHKLVEVKGLPEGDITNVTISDSEQLMAFYVSSSKSPANLFVYNFQNGEVKQLTQTMTTAIDPGDLVACEVVRFKSFDGLEIPSLLYKPRSVDKDHKAPVLLYIHGGPGGQTRLDYSPAIQYLVNHGYVILAVNNRGSSGYGKNFFAADDRKHGDADLKDCIESKKYLATLPYVDTTKIGIMGGSYGGYMVMAALAFTPNEFKVGVDLFGVTNWLRTLKSIPPWWGSFRDALYHELGDPTTADSTTLYNKSPLFFAKNIRKPFIVLQGSNDPRVLPAESDEIVSAAKANGIPVEYVVFPDEGHGFQKKDNNIKAYQAILKFVDHHLKGLPEDHSGEQTPTVQ